MPRRPAPEGQVSLPGTTTNMPAPAAAEPAAPQRGRRGARLREANRGQLAWGPIDLDAMLPQEHVARSIWAVLERLDLTALYSPIEARDEVAGTSAIDPKILLAVWVYATSEGEGSARAVWRLTEMHTAYRWLCGGVAVGYHTLSDFRSERGEVFSQLVTQVLALLMKGELIDLHRVAQDGTRIRASAGAASFRRQATLASLLDEARAHLEAVTREGNDAAMTARRAAAQQRGARDRLARLEAALEELPEIIATKKQSGAKDKEPRASTTDADARVMKMPDGGFRPAFNVQLATTTDEARVIVGMAVLNRGSDAQQSTPMLTQIQERTGVLPAELLVDGGYAQHTAIDEATAQGVTVYAPVTKPRGDDARDPNVALPGDSAAVGAWRERMGTEEAKAIYKERAATAETVNADAKRHRGLASLAVRGSVKVGASVALFVLTYDILRLLALGG
jgi:transposase